MILIHKSQKIVIQQTLVMAFMTVLEDVLDANNRGAVFEIDVRIVLEREPWIIGNHPSVVHFEIRLASF